MTRGITGKLLVATVACCLVGDALAQRGAVFNICNREKRADDVYLVAMLVRIPVFLKERWESGGWYEIKPGNCEKFSFGAVNTLYLLSVNRVTDKGRKVLNYHLKELPDYHWDSDSYGIEEFFCVSEEPFHRKASSRDAFRRCRTGEYLQLFNLHVFVEHNSSFTLNLK